MIYTGSRFIGNYLIRDRHSGVDFLSFPNLAKISPNGKDKVYQFKAGDRLDILAKKFYNDPQQAWKILYANPQYTNELEIEEGAIITIPDTGDEFY